MAPGHQRLVRVVAAVHEAQRDHVHNGGDPAGTHHCQRLHAIEDVMCDHVIIYNSHLVWLYDVVCKLRVFLCVD